MKPIGLVPELLVSSFKTSLAFYVDVLGFEVVFLRGEQKFAYLKLGNAEIMLEQIGVGRNWITKELEQPLGRGINFQIEVPDVNALYEKVKQTKPVFMEMEEKWYQQNQKQVGNKQFLVQDPDGYLLRLYQDLGTKDL